MTHLTGMIIPLDWTRSSTGGLFSRLPLEKQSEIITHIVTLITKIWEELDYFAKATPFISPLLLNRVIKQLDDNAKNDLIHRIYTHFASCFHTSQNMRAFCRHLDDLKNGQNVFEYRMFMEEIAHKKFGGSLGLQDFHRGVNETSFPAILPFDGEPTATDSSYGIYGKFHHPQEMLPKISFRELQDLSFASRFCENPMAVVVDLVNRINTRENFIYLLETLLDDEQAMYEIASRSAWHELGKLRIPLILIGDLSVVLHMWEISPQCMANNEHRHTHHGGFASYVASGKVDHFIYRSRAATEREIAIYQRFSDKILTMSIDDLDLILFSLRDIHTGSLAHPIYDSIIQEEVNRLTENRGILLTKQQLTEKLQMDDEEIEIISRVGPFNLNPLGEPLIRNQGYLYFEQPLIDNLQPNDSYYLSPNLVHKFIVNSQVAPTITCVVRKGHVQAAHQIEEISEETYAQIKQKAIRGGKVLRRRIQNQEELSLYLQKCLQILTFSP